MNTRHSRWTGVLFWVLLLGAGCETSGTDTEGVLPGSRLERRGDEISVCGQLFHTGSRVVLWNDPGGYDAYRPHRHFEPEKRGPAGNPDRIARYESMRRGLPEALEARVRREGWRVEDLRQVVTQVVIHFDACGVSRQCFRVLQDIRGLSTHFMIDLDGTIYQTLDVKERAWHAGVANEKSIGIEIAHFGAVADPAALQRWYREDGEGPRVVLPEALGDGGLPAGFVPRPARSEVFEGAINGRRVFQRDFTEQQYVALENLLLALRHILPAIAPTVPTDETGGIVGETLEPESLEKFAGLVAHWHVSKEKVDPGPAFNWARVLGVLREGR